MSLLIVFTLILFLISIPYRREKVRNPQGKKREFCYDLKTAYKIMFDSLENEYPDRVGEFNIVLKMCHNNYKQAVLSIEQTLMDEEANTTKSQSNGIMALLRV